MPTPTPLRPICTRPIAGSRPRRRSAALALGAMLAATTLGVPHAAAVDAAAPVALDVTLGQSAILAGAGEKIYLRIKIDGIRPHHETPRAPVNVAIVIDRSGSMGGDKIRQAREAALMALDRLEANDTLSVVAYNHKVDVLVPAGRIGGRSGLRQKIRAMRPSGRTALYAGTRAGIGQVREYLDANRVNRVILLSDGLANVGPSKPSDLARLGRAAVDDGISITTIGLGLGYNEDLMAKLAYNSDGNHAFVEKASDLVKIFNQEFGNVLSVVAQDIIIDITVEPGFTPKRILGRDAEITGNRIKVRFNQIYASQQKYLVLELEGSKAGQVGEKPVARINARYRKLGAAKGADTGVLERTVHARITASQNEAEASVDKDVMTSVTTQIATEASTRAVELRDRGDIAGAKRLLERNATYLKSRSAAYGSAELGALSAQSAADAVAVAKPEDWNRNRKAMRAGQHKQRVQQTY